MAKRSKEKVTRVTRESPISGKMVSMYIDAPPDMIEQWEKWNRQPDTPQIHEYFPDMPDEQREFLLSSIPPNEWEELFGEGKKE